MAGGVRELDVSEGDAVARRIRGLVIIVRSLFPILAVLALVLVTWLTARAVVDATVTYGEQMNEQLDGVRAAVDEANDGIEAIGRFVGATTGAAEALLSRVAEIPDAIDVPMPAIEIPAFDIPIIDYTITLPAFSPGDLGIPIPGVGPLKDMALDLAEAGREIAQPLTKVTALADIPPHLEEAAHDTAVYAGDVRSSMGTWLRVVVLVLVLAGVVWVAVQIRPMLEELGRGWAMLRGRPDPGKAVVGLEQRVRELERRLVSYG